MKREIRDLDSKVTSHSVSLSFNFNQNVCPKNNTTNNDINLRMK